NVGWSLVSQVILSILNLDPRDYHDLVVRSGEIGEALSKVWPSRGTGYQHHELIARVTSGPLTLQDLAASFDELAKTGVVERKRRILTDLFTRCVDPREAAYLAKIIFRELRSGAREGVLQAAIAQAFEKDLSQIQRCQLLVGDLDEVAVLAKQNALEAAQFRLF